jgi:hypothetical protein
VNVVWFVLSIHRDEALCVDVCQDLAKWNNVSCHR